MVCVCVLMGRGGVASYPAFQVIPERGVAFHGVCLCVDGEGG